MTTLKVSAGVQVSSSGPSISLATAIEVDAYTKIEFTLTKENNVKAFNLGILGDTIQFVVIKSDLNDSDAVVKPALTYTAGKAFTLDSPHLYMGQGFVQSLKDAGIDFTNLSFTFTALTDEAKENAKDNKKTVEDAQSVKVEILVGGPLSKPPKTSQ
jgi:hypothetical protein